MTRFFLVILCVAFSVAGSSQELRQYSYAAYMYVDGTPVPGAHVLFRGTATGASARDVLANIMTLLGDPEAKVDLKGTTVAYSHGDIVVTIEMDGVSFLWHPVPLDPRFRCATRGTTACR